MTGSIYSHRCRHPLGSPSREQGPDDHEDFHATATVGLLLNLAFFVCLVTAYFGTFAMEAIDDTMTAVVPTVAWLLCLFRGRRRLSRAGRGWLHLGLCCVLWGIGGTIWASDELVLKIPVPFPSLADVAYLLAVPFAVLGLIGLSELKASISSGLRTFMDTALAAGALLFVIWATVLDTAFSQASGSLLDRAMALSYPFSDVAIATVALLAMAGARGQRRTSLAMIGSGLLAIGISDSAFAYFTTHGNYGTGNDFDAGYVVGYVLIGLAALQAERPAAPGETETSGRLAMALPYLPLIVARVVVVGMHVSHHPTGAFLFWDGMSLVTLVLARQLLGLFTNRALSRKLQASRVALLYQAFHDSLTGLPNRALVAQQVDAALAVRQDRSVIVMLLDLDGFKQVNDTLGHPAGDRLLVIVADRLRLVIRQEDVVARLCGDEFAVLLHGRATLQDGYGVAERILETQRNRLISGTT